MRHQNLFSFKVVAASPVWHIRAKGTRKRTRCGQTTSQETTLLAWPLSYHGCLKCWASWVQENGEP